jgi:hypothetical protein
LRLVCIGLGTLSAQQHNNTHEDGQRAPIFIDFFDLFAGATNEALTNATKVAELKGMRKAAAADLNANPEKTATILRAYVMSDEYAR